jgi:hypothetical protein
VEEVKIIYKNIINQTDSSKHFYTTNLPLNMLFAMEPQGTIGLSLASLW